MIPPVIVLVPPAPTLAPPAPCVPSPVPELPGPEVAKVVVSWLLEHASAMARKTPSHSGKAANMFRDFIGSPRRQPATKLISRFALGQECSISKKSITRREALSYARTGGA